MKRYRPVIFISFYMIILIIIAAQLWGANGFLHPAIENINLYVRELRNTHAPLFHQSYDNYLQLLPGILLIGLKLGGVKEDSNGNDFLFLSCSPLSSPNW